MFKIVDERNEKLHRFHEDITFLLRDGKVGGHTGKSQNHIHFHLIPDFDLAEAETKSDVNREFFEQEEYETLVTMLKKKYL
jgi:diadenosine tetraphosphate (Ap4A) HIT family hydrolase